MTSVNKHNIAVIGGTHGDELTGLYLINKLKDNFFFDIAKFKNSNISLHIGNPDAVAICRRYVDKDLNRSFTEDALEDSNDDSQEAKRATYFNELLGPKGSSKADCIIDLHTAASDMGMTIIPTSLSDDSKSILNYFIKSVPQSKILLGFTHDNSKQPYIASISDLGFGIELGPISMGVISYEHITTMKNSLCSLLTILDNRPLEKASSKLDAFQMHEVIQFPKSGDEISAIVHPEVSCYKALSKGDPFFITFDDQVINYERDEPMYPVFINEPAYLKDNVAMILCKKISI